uniref:Ribosomal protein L16 n=1 Tax=Montagnia macrospora TaxID=2662032 RepID=A0A343UXT4_9FLOR|nr:ribosomal protein L16 [Montagnia macrospora]AVK39491.1 ribosomal protein L16 [Montagnia macrospora]
MTESQYQTLMWFLQKKLKKLEKKTKIKVWVCFSPNLVLTKLNSEARMGKGKGLITEVAMFLKPGQIVVELDNLSTKQSRELCRYINQKFSGELKLVFRSSQL